MFLTMTSPVPPTSPKSTSPTGSRIGDIEKPHKKTLRQSLTNLSILERRENKDKDKEKDEAKDKSLDKEEVHVHKRKKPSRSLFFKSREEKENTQLSPEFFRNPDIPVPPPLPPSSRSKSGLSRSNDKIKREKDKDKEKEKEKEKEKIIPVCEDPQDHHKLSGFLARFFQNRPPRQILVEKHILLTEYKTPDTLVIPLRPACIRAIGARLELIDGFDREGLFRIPGSVLPVREIWKRFQEPVPDFTEDPRTKEQSHNEYAGALKLYLREAPESAIPTSYYESFLKVLDSAPEEQVDKLLSLINQFDKESKDVIEELLILWSKVIHLSSKNKMDVKNIGIVFGPSVLRQKLADPLALMDLKLTQRQSAVVELLVENAQKLFPSIEEELKTFEASVKARDLAKALNPPQVNLSPSSTPKSASTPNSPPLPTLHSSTAPPTNQKEWVKVVANKGPKSKLILSCSTTSLPTASSCFPNSTPLITSRHSIQSDLPTVQLPLEISLKSHTLDSFGLTSSLNQAQPSSEVSPILLRSCGGSLIKPLKPVRSRPKSDSQDGNLRIVTTPTKNLTIQIPEINFPSPD